MDHISFTGLLGELVELALAVIRMQEILRLLAARLAKVIIVERLNFGIEMAHAKSRLLVVGVETRCTRGTNLIGSEARLTAAADATTAASHDFDEIVARLDTVLEILANLIENLLDVTHLMCNGNIDRRITDLDRSGLDAIHATHIVELEARRRVFLRDQAVRRTQGSLHDTASDAEDRAGTRVGAKKIVGRLVGKRHEVDTGSLDHACEFARRKDDIGILATRRAHVLVTRDLVLLRRAGHDGCDVHLLARETVLLGPIRLRERGEHLLRRLGR